MRLRRVYEAAEEEGLPVEEVGADRFGSLQAFEEAKKERRILEEREGRRGDRGREQGRGMDRPSHFSKVLRAKLMGTPDVEKLAQEYEAEARKVHGAGEGCPDESRSIADFRCQR